jgi:hypothetical protein
MSKGKFRMIVHPVRIDLDATPPKRIDSSDYKVLALLDSDPNSDFSFKDFDNRTNYPNYSYDNSNSPPDNVLDYVVILYRISPAIAPTWGTAVASVLGSGNTYLNGYSIKQGHMIY